MARSLRDSGPSIGLLVLRVGIGGFLLSHGIGKLRLLLSGASEGFDVIGLGAGTSLFLVTIAEFLCAILVMVGLATRPASAIVVLSMGVAAFVAHAANPWTMEKGYILYMSKAAESWASKEPALLFLIPMLALVFTGAGAFSIDAWIRRRWAARRTAAA
ncbi:MAG TPA: DoxX family protein [Thermoanaerobaculia bacterium]|jgi:putative oxidoreductase